jgi:CubicO group peptidase (beta-lactamase class C family)
MREVMARAVERGDVPGLVALVHRRGETHVAALGTMAAGGDAPMRRDTIFRIASMTKLITAAAAMILVEECRLRLDDPVDDLLPELADRRVLRRIDAPLDDTVAAERSITVRDVHPGRAFTEASRDVIGGHRRACRSGAVVDDAGQVADTSFDDHHAGRVARVDASRVERDAFGAQGPQYQCPEFVGTDDTHPSRGVAEPGKADGDVTLGAGDRQ